MRFSTISPSICAKRFLQASIPNSFALKDNDVIEGMNQGLTYDTIIIDLHLAWESLKEIIGNVDKEELLDSIFKNFCLGK